MSYAISSAARMHQLIDSLLFISGIGRATLPPSDINLNVVLETAKENLKTLIEENGAKVTCEKPLPVVRGHHVELVQLFQNLLSNGIKFRSEQHPQITVSHDRMGDQWVFAISDNGVGFSGSDSLKLFQIFQTLGADSSGTGIGLAICKKIVEHHGGKIWAKSHPGTGATFFFTLAEVE